MLEAEKIIRHRVLEAVKPHFDAAEPQTFIQAENHYPQTTQCLFDAALHVVDGKWGESIKDKFSRQSERVSSPPVVLALLVIDICHYPQPIPEVLQGISMNAKELQECDEHDIEKLIFEENRLVPMDKISVPPEQLTALMQLFDSYINHLNNPSSAFIPLLIEHHHVERAEQTALQLHSPGEKCRALRELIDYHLDRNELKRAEQIWGHIPPSHEQHECAVKLIEKWVENGWADQALGFISSLPKHHARDMLSKEAALSLTRHNQIEKALDVTRSIAEKDIEAYTISHIVRLLARQNKFHLAKEIAQSILDEGFKEDAIVEIVKGYIHLRRVEEGVKFIDSLPEGEKKKPVQIIETSLKAHHEDQKIRGLLQHFLSHSMRA